MAPSALATQATAPLLGEDGRIEQPLLVVDLDGEPEDVVAAATAATASDRVLVGISRGRAPAPGWEPLVRALDLTVVPPGSDRGTREVVAVPDAAAAALALSATARAHPHASVVLAGLLRWSGELDVPAALDAESLAYSTLLGGPEFAAWLARRGPRPLPPPAPEEPVRLRRDGDELRLTLNRPERRNAYGRQLRDALVSALELVAWDDGVVRVVLDGAGPSFCSGGDLDEFGTAPDPVTAHLVRTRVGAALPLHRVADRVEVRLHGACVGAGIELPAYAHRIVAAPDTRIRLPEIGMGLIPGAGGTVSIPRRIGRWRTLYLALSATVIDARTALSWGLVDSVASGPPTV
ncbi:enoyl-CoA hydratase/isomerase family protein [Geodermatophilus sp. URMC 63]